MTENIRSAIARLSCSIFRVLVATKVCISPCGAVFAQQQAPSGGQAQPAAKTSGAEDDNLKYETLKVGKEGAVLFVEIAAPPSSEDMITNTSLMICPRAHSRYALRVGEGRSDCRGHNFMLASSQPK
jgi:hypothetical protein